MASDTAGALLHAVTARLADCSPSPREDAEMLLLHALDWPRTRLFTHPEEQLSGERRQLLEKLVKRRIAGEPVAYITGTRGFWTLDLQVDARVLIPRPETELLVERALTLRPGSPEASVLDTGTGSGAIALALASERPRWRITATDRSPDALAVASTNGAHLGLQVEWLQGSWFQPVPGRRFNLIVSNPPYVADDDAHLELGDVRFEPDLALTAGPTGLDALFPIIDDAPRHLEPGGWLLLEHGFDQAEAVAERMRRRGFAGVAGHRDLAGQPRVTEGYFVHGQSG